MTDTPRKATQPDVAKIREDIRETRQQLGDTVEALAHKADVPARTKEKANEVLDTTKAKAAVAKDTVMAKADQAIEAAQVKAAEVAEQAQHAVEKLPQPVAQRAERVIAVIRQRPGMVLAGAIVSIALVRRVALRNRQD
jgi:phage-related tail protein